MERSDNDPDIVSLPLPCGAVAFVSAEDWPRVSRLSWCNKGDGYVHASFKKKAGGDGRMVALHRFIMAAPAGFVVDHIDGNPLNNCRANLQITTLARNSMRSKTAKNGGVSFDKSRGKWRVRIRYEGRQLDLGSYADEATARAVAVEGRRALWEPVETNPTRATY